METICMKCQCLLSGKIKKNIINLSSAEVVHRVVKAKAYKIQTQEKTQNTYKLQTEKDDSGT